MESKGLDLRCDCYPEPGPHGSDDYLGGREAHRCGSIADGEDGRCSFCRDGHWHSWQHGAYEPHSPPKFMVHAYRYWLQMGSMGERGE